VRTGSLTSLAVRANVEVRNTIICLPLEARTVFMFAEVLLFADLMVQIQ